MPRSLGRDPEPVFGRVAQRGRHVLRPGRHHHQRGMLIGRQVPCGARGGPAGVIGADHVTRQALLERALVRHERPPARASWASMLRSRCYPAGEDASRCGVLHRLGRPPVGLVGGDAAGGGGGRRFEPRVDQEFLQGGLDPPGWCVRGESLPGVQLLDAARVEGLIAPERQQQLRHAMGEGAKHRSQSTMPDHRRHLGHEAIVVGEGHDLHVFGDTHGIAVDRWAEREDGLQFESRLPRRRGRSTPSGRP